MAECGKGMNFDNFKLMLRLRPSQRPLHDPINCKMSRTSYINCSKNFLLINDQLKKNLNSRLVAALKARPRGLLIAVWNDHRGMSSLLMVARDGRFTCDECCRS